MSLNPMARTASYAALALVITDHPVVTRPVTVASGNNLKRGALVGKITASKKVVLSLSAASDGSEKPYGVLMEDVDATDGDKAGRVYRLAGIDETLVTFGAGHTADTVRDELDAQGLHLFSAQAID